jgi:hypothetical protein
MNALPMRSLITGVVTAVAIAGVVGCADPEPVEWPADPPSPDPGQPAAAEDPAEADAAEEILAVVDGFREAEVEAYANPQPVPIARLDLSPYLADPMLGEVLGTLHTMREAGIAFEGRPTWDPTVVEVRLDATPRTATVRDCVDATRWESVFEDTSDPVPGDELPDRYVMRIEAMFYPEHGWLLYDFLIEEDERC